MSAATTSTRQFMLGIASAAAWVAGLLAVVAFSYFWALMMIALVLRIFPNDTSPWLLQPIFVPLELVPLAVYLGWTVRAVAMNRRRS